MICLACDGKIKPIKEDSQTWKRKYHKKCWHERFIYYGLVDKCEKLGITKGATLPYDPTDRKRNCYEDYLKRCCTK